MKKIYGENAPYYSQRNNVRSPSRACGVTSIINALIALGYSLPLGIGQPEDRLYDFIADDPNCKALYALKQSKIPIQEWQDILALGTNRWLKKEVAHFDEVASKEAILSHLTLAGVCVVTGEFPISEERVLHHTVTIIGYETETEGEGDPRTDQISRWWIRDPWGDHRTLYRSIRGHLIDLKPEEFDNLLKKVKTDRKWCIFIKRPE